MGRGKLRDLALFLKFLRHPGQRFIGQFGGCKAVLAIKVGGQPAVHFKVFLAAGIDALVEPMKKTLKRALGRCPILFHALPLK